MLSFRCYLTEQQANVCSWHQPGPALVKVTDLFDVPTAMQPLQQHDRDTHACAVAMYLNQDNALLRQTSTSCSVPIPFMHLEKDTEYTILR